MADVEEFIGAEGCSCGCILWQKLEGAQPCLQRLKGIHLSLDLARRGGSGQEMSKVLLCKLLLVHGSLDEFVTGRHLEVRWVDGVGREIRCGGLGLHEHRAGGRRRIRVLIGGRWVVLFLFAEASEGKVAGEHGRRALLGDIASAGHGG